MTQVSGFGLSCFKPISGSEKITERVGTQHWMAPEMTISQHYTEKVDVFSYGILLWEIFTRTFSVPVTFLCQVIVQSCVWHGFFSRLKSPRS
ncbi:unnamed protein product, partial [Sphacelaria rigidula]